MSKIKGIAIAVGGLLLVGGIASVALRDDSGGAKPLEEIPEDVAYDRPYGDDAPWNIPVSEIERDPNSDELSEIFWKYSSANGPTDPEARGRVMLALDDWSSPIYDATEATGTKRVFTANYGFPGNVTDGDEIPWNDSWKPASAADAEMIIIDPETGREWNLWLVQTSNFSGCLSLTSGFVPFKDLCLGRANLIMAPDGTVADYRTSEAGFPSKGSGLPNLALTLTAEEIAAGRIEHAMGLDIFNTMFGPECSESEMGTEAAGVSCGYYVSPSTRLEWTDGPAKCGTPQENTDERRSVTIPEGTRFALDITDEEIDEWLDQRGYPENRRRTARIIAEGLRDYGWIISDTSCGGVTIPTDGISNPKTKELWKVMGIEGDKHRDLMVGLFTEDNIYALTPPSEPLPTGKP